MIETNVRTESKRRAPRASWWRLPAGAALLAGSSLLLTPALAGEKPYTVECDEGAASGTQCKVDKATYIGWRTYHAFCHVCHAQDAVGSTFAPSLVERLQAIDKARFLTVLADGYTGQLGVMPAWKDDPNVNKRYEELYAYLQARADGKLPPGRPARLK